MNTHTPEPWEYVEESQCSGDFTRYYQTVKDSDGNNIVRFSAQNGEANARRIVACVNACAGIPTEELITGESIVIHGLRHTELLLAEQQRDELLERNKQLCERQLDLANREADLLVVKNELLTSMKAAANWIRNCSNPLDAACELENAIAKARGKV